MKKLLLVLIFCSIFIVSNVYADAVQRMNQEIENLKPIPDKLNALLDDMEKTRLVTEKNGGQYNKILMDYAKRIRKSSSALPEMTKKWVDSKGKENQGMEKVIANYEKMASEHEKKFKELEKKAQRVDDKIKSGEIKLAPEILKSMTKEEREEFYKFLSEPARKEYKKQYPDLFAKGFNYIMEFIAPSAEAANLRPCIPLCPAVNPACVACVIVLGADAAYQQWDTFQKAWNWCGELSRWWRYACRTAAVAVFIAWIA